VISFYVLNNIDMSDMSAHYKEGIGRSCQQNDNITIEHYYRIDLFNAVIDFQLLELDNRFTERTMELLVLSSALNPIDGFKSFNIDDICSLASKFYPADFTQVEMGKLRRQLQLNEYDVLCHPNFQNMSSFSELCRKLVETRKGSIYFLIDRLVCLVLTLPVSTSNNRTSILNYETCKNNTSE
jgi:hypothetical protein